MQHLRRFSTGIVATVVTLVVVVAVIFARGGRMFSPGELNAQSRGGVALGGAHSHAELGGKCSACHVAPWSRETMADRCLACHTDVRDQLSAKKALHGMLPDGRDCRSCHSEHKGAHGPLTSLERFDHDWTAFKLTGKHRTVDCKSCHINNVFKGTAQTCVSCHAEPQAHKGKYGTSCAQCHSTSTWEGATFKHTFPLNHGRRGRGPIACAVCHPTANSFTTYTCYGCHEHSRERMVRRHARRRIENLDKCADCHPTGRERRGGGRERRRAQGFDLFLDYEVASLLGGVKLQRHIAEQEPPQKVALLPRRQQLADLLGAFPGALRLVPEQEQRAQVVAIPVRAQPIERLAWRDYRLDWVGMSLTCPGGTAHPHGCAFALPE
jgi:hypothetical protein